mmetsp:Transcript_124321/g.337656  ORF Transcript_124321/g.337656 Transcript_124321/m.337656 type:complete len:291 (-) Transcript_124321:815-1687(-)
MCICSIRHANSCNASTASDRARFAKPHTLVSVRSKAHARSHLLRSTPRTARRTHITSRPPRPAVSGSPGEGCTEAQPENVHAKIPRSQHAIKVIQTTAERRLRSSRNAAGRPAANPGLLEKLPHPVLLPQPKLPKGGPHLHGGPTAQGAIEGPRPPARGGPPGPHSRLESTRLACPSSEASILAVILAASPLTMNCPSTQILPQERASLQATTTARPSRRHTPLTATSSSPAGPEPVMPPCVSKERFSDASLVYPPSVTLPFHSPGGTTAGLMPVAASEPVLDPGPAGPA